jgi:tryptophanyl-tRNA synthetase
MFAQRVLSGMRSTGALHLGHYHGVLKNWLHLQSEYPCFFFAADWHALTTNYENPRSIKQYTHDMVIDWLSAGIDPNNATIFVQSQVTEHAELFLLLSMGTPLSWLERVPTYKDQMEKLKDKDLSTYGFLGYPLLQAADILIYRAGHIPVGEDQVPHIEMTREIARRFNYLYGKQDNFEADAILTAKKLGSKLAKLFLQLRTQYHEQGNIESLARAKSIIDEAQNLSISDHELLFSYVEGGRKIILNEPQALLTQISRMPGLDGQKMSKSYGNTIAMREDKASIERKIKTMPTDPARVRLTDAGDPNRCPVWEFHKVYSDEETKSWVRQGCTSASIGCLDCKRPVIDAIIKEQEIFFERAEPYLSDSSLVKSILANGCDKAREIAKETMNDVREVMGL